MEIHTIRNVSLWFGPVSFVPRVFEHGLIDKIVEPQKKVVELKTLWKNTRAPSLETKEKMSGTEPTTRADWCNC